MLTEVELRKQSVIVGRAVWIIVAVLIVALGIAQPVGAALFTCASGDVACLIVSINTANANGEVNVIRLDAGTCTLTRSTKTLTDRMACRPSAVR